MDPTQIAVIAVLFFAVAVIYSSVGHAGASGYAAVMSLLSVAPEALRPTALVLNVAVGALALVRFYRADLIRFKKLAPFIVGSMPAAYFAAQVKMDKHLFFGILGGVLLFSAVKMFDSKASGGAERQERSEVNHLIALICGAVIGALSGLTGTGGGIFFTPLVIMAGWASPREASGLSVAFVLVNSLWGLVGLWQAGSAIPLNPIWIWVLVVLAGAMVGTHLGINRFSHTSIRRVLAIVLLIAGLKLLGTALA